MTKNRALRYLHTHVTDEEMTRIDKFIVDNGFTTQAEFFRAAISAYMGEDIFRPRFHDPKLKIDQWNKKDKILNTKGTSRVKDYLASLNPEEPEPFGGWNFAGGRVVLNTDRQRIQIFFDEAPEKETTQLLRLNHYAWKPKPKAWETWLTMSGVKKARALECIKPL